MNLVDALRDQGRACESLGSPFMNVLLGAIADNIAPGDPISDRLLNWPGDISGKADSVSLRLAGALHALVLTNQSPQLAAQYPPNNPNAIWPAVKHAFIHHTDHIRHWLDSPPQTNEVRRSAVLIPAVHIVAARFGLPLRLSELGASGGLNLMFDQFELEAGTTTYHGPGVTLTPIWEGTAPTPSNLLISERRGVDLNPLDPKKPDDQLRLRAYLWADQPDRLTRTNAAIEAFDATVDSGDVEAWLKDRLAAPHNGQSHFVYHTVAWQYFPEITKANCKSAIETAGSKATVSNPLAWFSMEADDALDKGAKLTLRMWPGDVTLDLGRADFHGRWVKWNRQTA